MKILYGIQGTGHGHLSRAKELLPELQKHASVDVMISGSTARLSIDGSVRYRKYGISMTYDSNGGVSVLNTLRDLRPIRFISDVQSVSVTDYDLVVSDYEPISSWSARFREVPTVGLSHQAAFMSPKTPRPANKSLVAEALLRHFAPADRAIGFHFRRYDDFIEPPIIRSPIRELEVTDSGHVTVYLPAYHHTVLKEIFGSFRDRDWHIFAPSCDSPYREGNFRFHPVSNRRFLDSFGSCRGLICNAGFESCAEAMFMGKKLLAIPIRNQYEQECNAAALQQLGVKTLDSLENAPREIEQWLEYEEPVRLEKFADPAGVVRAILNFEAPEYHHSRANQKSLFFQAVN